MLTVTVNRVKPDKEAALRSWFEEMTGRRDEVADTLREQSVRHVQAFIVRTSDGPLLVLAAETEDMVLAREAFQASTAAIDADFKRVMSEALEGHVDDMPVYECTVDGGAAAKQAAADSTSMRGAAERLAAIRPERTKDVAG